jgi:hypothetical protein
MSHHRDIKIKRNSLPPPPQKQPLLNRCPLHLSPLHLRQKRPIPKIVQIQIQVPARSPLPRSKEHLPPVDTRIAHEAQQELATIFERCEGDARGLDVVEGVGGEDGGTDVPVGE